jgi:GH25 family lysozyme M1 (1,4-beta-N-acetylmuramidase)
VSGRFAAAAAAMLALSLLIASLAPAVQGASGGVPGVPAAKPTHKPRPTPTPLPTTTPTATPSPSPTATPSYLEGLDVSVYQNTIDWTQVAAAGKKFAIVRASAGSLTADTRYAANRSGAKAAGLPMAAYHFANPDTATNDALNEANWFLQNASPTHGDLIPALDVEVTNGLSVSAMQAWVSTWLTRVSAVTGVKPMIYSSPNFWATSMGDTRQFADSGYKVLWIAHWTSASQPTVPAANWGGNGWTFWQYTSSGTVPGITGNVDLDRYNGTTLASSLFIP